MFQTVAEFIIPLASILTLITLKMLITPQPQPVFNVYRRPNSFYWLKVLLIYPILAFRKFSQKFGKSDAADENLEKPQKLSFRDKAVDAVYFNGCNAQGDYFIATIARRKNKLVDNFLLMKIVSSDLGVLETIKLPITSSHMTDKEDDNSYSIDGLKMSCVTPMKKWRITFGGKLKQADSVQVDLQWTSDFPSFNFETSFDVLALAKDIALEPWSTDYFDTLTKFHKIHYEQFGKLEGTVSINGKKYCLSLNSSRGHMVHEKLDWRSFHRYSIHYIYTEGGDCFVVGKICAPVLFSDLTVGYMYSAETKKLNPIQKCDLELYQHGEDGNPPTDYAFSFAAGCQWYAVQVNVLNASHLFMSEGLESKFTEAFITAEINGKKAWGICEWQYRNI